MCGINYQLRIPSNQINKSRKYTSIATNQSLHSVLNPWFITGFVDAEGSFLIIISKDKKYKTGWRVIPCFLIGLHQKDLALLEQIQSHFSVGNITKHGSLSIQYRVQSIKDLSTIIEHFEKYPLITKKRADFLLFKMAVNLINNKEHLTIEGLQKIISLRASMNLGLSDELNAAFSNITPIHRPSVSDYKIQDPHWLAGFTSGEGCFIIRIMNSSTHHQGFQVILKFQITQDIRDEELLISLVSYLGCGLYRKRAGTKAGDFLVTKFSDVIEKIIPFFEKYKINGVKLLDFDDFKQVSELMKNKAHLTTEGLDQISKIKTGMNRGRKS